MHESPGDKAITKRLQQEIRRLSSMQKVLETASTTAVAALTVPVVALANESKLPLGADHSNNMNFSATMSLSFSVLTTRT